MRWSLAVAPWRWIFWLCLLAVAAVALAVARLPETLAPENRLDLRLASVGSAVRRVFTTRVTFGYMMAMTLLMGVFTSYIASSEIIISEVFDRESQFPFIFGIVAAVLGVLSLLNARLVRRLGLRVVVTGAVGIYLASAVGCLAVVAAEGGRPPFWLFFPVLAAGLGMHVLTVPNMNALAMTPVGDIAGTASAVVGAVSLGGGAALGAVIDSRLSDSVTPLAVGFVAAISVAAVGMWMTERSSRSPDPALSR